VHGKKTKSIAGFVGLDKEYEAEMVLGGRTESFDRATPVVETRSTEGVDEERVRTVLAEFTGPRLQMPPMWSAVSVKGKRLYKYAREGVEVDRLPREIVIHGIEPSSSVCPWCGSGSHVQKGRTSGASSARWENGSDAARTSPRSNEPGSARSGSPMR